MANAKDTALNREERKPTKAEIAAALKIEAGYASIDFNYNTIVLPHDDAIALMGCLKNAERLYYEDGGYHTIRPTRDSNVSMKLMSKQEYIDSKMSAVFGIEVKNT